MRQVQFAPNCSKPALWAALCHYQQKEGNVDKSAPVDFLAEDQRAALTATDGKFRVSLYKALFFVEVAEAIKSGALNLLHSEKFRSLDEYLIQKADWEANRAEYLQRAQLEGFADCKATLKALEKELDARYKETNQNLIDRQKPLSDNTSRRQLPCEHSQTGRGGMLVSWNLLPGTEIYFHA